GAGGAHTGTTGASPARRARSPPASPPPRSPVAPVTSTGRSRHTSGAIRPNLPRRPGPLPRLGEVLQVTRRVHALPVAVVRVHLELAVLGEALERVALEHAAVGGGQILEERAFEDEESAVDEAIRHGRLLAELDHAGATRHQLAEARGRTDTGHGPDPAVALVKGHELPDVDVGHAVTVRQHESRTVDVALDSLDAGAGQRGGTGVGEGHRPALGQPAP